MSQPEIERRPRLWFQRLVDKAPEAGSEGRMRELELLGLVNGVVFLAALVVLVGSFPFALSSLRLAALIVLMACCGFALWQRRRFWAALDSELQRRRRAEQEARAADHAKGQFLADVSHEIRTPMHGVLGMADLLLRGELTPVQREEVEAIRTSAEALLALTNDILDLSRIEAGRLELRLRDFRLQELAVSVVQLLAPQAAARDVDLYLQLASELQGVLHGDPVRLRQVLLNLTGNAIRFTHHGSVIVSFDLVKGEKEAPAIRCQVRDTGAGIRPEVQARLFQPFTQSDSAIARQLGGTGLGLVISKSVVELTGGTIGFESTHGAGSTFWFKLPLVRAQGTGVLARPEVPDTGRETKRRAARHAVRVLVVDDHPVNRTLALAQLRDLGYLVDVAEGGEAALSLLAGRPYDAVLLDCAMPELDGYETCRRLRQMETDGRHVPVIALTAHAMEGEQEKCLAAGMDDFLAKPYQTETLAALLDSWVGIGTAAPESQDAGRIEERLAEMQRLGEKTGDKLLESVVKAFLDRGTEDLEAMEAALAEGNGGTLAAAAHSLGGSSGFLGAMVLAERCSQE